MTDSELVKPPAREVGKLCPDDRTSALGSASRLPVQEFESIGDAMRGRFSVLNIVAATWYTAQRRATFAHN